MQHKVYPKIPTTFKRQELENGKFSKYLDGDLRRPELTPYMNHTTNWIVSEKLDGENTRIIWDGYTSQVKGRTEKSVVLDVQKELLEELSANDNYLFEEVFGEKEAIIYGESFGGKIGGNPYNTTPDFQVFDINIGGLWLDYDSVEEISNALGLRVVPHDVVTGWNGVIELLSDLFFEARELGSYFEGVVALPEHMPLTHKGERVITKLKVKDLDTFSEEYLAQLADEVEEELRLAKEAESE